VAVRVDPTTLKSETASLVDAYFFLICLDIAREARLESERTRAKSRALRAELDRIVEQSRAFEIKLRSSEGPVAGAMPGPKARCGVRANTFYLGSSA
jgi:hypothetical protein